MKKTSYIALSLLALAGCQAVEITPSIVESSSKVFTASTEIATKTSLDNELNVRWSANDQVSVFAANTHNDKYQVSPESAGQTSADLNYVSGTGFTAGTELPANIAYYPYSSTTTIAKAAEAYNLNVTLPETQTYAANSFGNGAFPMVAVTATAENRNFAFKNVCGALKLQLKGTASIASIAVSGNNNEILCGTATVTAQNSAVPTIAMTGSGKTVTLDCGAGVQLNESTATQFVIVLPPVAMTGGFTALITDTDGGIMEVSTTKSKTIERSGILKMGEVTYEGVLNEHDVIPDYIENGVNLGKGIAVLGDWNDDGNETTLYWAPVNCGYEEVGEINTESDHRVGKYYQWGAGDSSLNYQYEGHRVTARSLYYDVPSPELWYTGLYPEISDKWNNDQGPCPDGWRLPTSNEFKVLSANLSSVPKGTYAGQTNTYKGAELFGANLDKTPNTGVFFPYAGLRGGNGDSMAWGGFGVYWSSTLDMRGTRVHPVQALIQGSSTYPENTSWTATYAFSVRCVAE